MIGQMAKLQNRNYERPSAEELRRMYDASTGIREMGLKLGVAATTARKWLLDAGIKTLSISEAKAGIAPSAKTLLAMVALRRKHVVDGMPAVGYKLRSDGYVYLRMPGHSMATKDGYVLEHRYVMSLKLGRSLRDDEDVHHRNEIRHDNRPENLEVMTHSEHLKEHYLERGVDELGRFR